MSSDDLIALARRTTYCVHRLAGALRLTRRTLTRHFRAKLNSSPGDWLAQRRMCDAMTLLREGRVVKEVADALGYHQPPQFCREFRRRLGCTPSEFAAQQTPHLPLLLRTTQPQPLSPAVAPVRC